MPEWPHITLVILAYLVGGLSPGYWLARRRTGIDIRETGSGATGATNVGRVLGRSGFITVVALDVLKGMGITAIACYAMDNTPIAWQLAAALAVVVGHIWPLWLGFRGGKGVATFLGAWVVLVPNPPLPVGLVSLLVCLGLAVVLYPILRRSYKIAWLTGLALLPGPIWWYFRDPTATTVAAATVIILWWSHRDNFSHFIHGRPKTTDTATHPSHTH